MKSMNNVNKKKYNNYKRLDSSIKKKQYMFTLI